MAEPSDNIRTLYTAGEKARKQLETYSESNTTSYQDLLTTALKNYEKCRTYSRQISLFSSNETLEDISSKDLQYLLIDFYLAELTLKSSHDGGLVESRKTTLARARGNYEAFLKLLDSYDLLSPKDVELFERFVETPDTFMIVASTSDAAAKREKKIARYREEKELKNKLEVVKQYLDSHPDALRNDEQALRDLHLTNLRLSIHQTFQSLESISLELQVLAVAPTTPAFPTPVVSDTRQESRQDTYSEPLDAGLSRLRLSNPSGPILSPAGKPLQPFTLLDTRSRLRHGVFRPGHNLPTMTIDEYLEEERRRGGILDSGEEESGRQPEIDEDDLEKSDQATMKAREWDEFTEANPKYVARYSPGSPPFSFMSYKVLRELTTLLL
ncbi:MAG: hypothetical protein M1829_003112 [Trizodia sp. TS-e1964]|nr:MAG: hypothetical protein M1829_003112 [Trizodia sp. TS-e1964]